MRRSLPAVAIRVMTLVCLVAPLSAQELSDFGHNHNVVSCDGAACGGTGQTSWGLPLFGSSCSGLIKSSDGCFNDFISPMINFVFFEDPRTLTELRPIFVNHRVPNTIGNGIPAGGSIQLYALQFRAALTDRLSLIATKDGYIVDNTDGALDTLLGDGWADVSAGLKYNILRDPNSGTLASAGFTYEIPMGSSRALQGLGDGELHLFATGGQRLLGGDAHFLTSFGYRLPIDSDVNSTSFHWSNHVDFRVTDSIYAFTEIAWWHWTDSANNGAALGVAGQDLFNLPVNDVTGNDLVTQSVGLKLKPTASTEVGLAYEFPISGFDDVIDDRLMLDLIVRF
ncbi:MAG: hypothetical protein AB8G99_05235 [Planctomycetaceae bacterium]